MGIRKTQPIESRYVAEWVARQPGNAIWSLRVPLGNPIEGMEGSKPTRRTLKIARPWRQEVDALGVFSNKLVLVEAKVNRFGPGVWQLNGYEKAIRRTPELEQYSNLPIEKVLIVPHVPSNLRDAAEDEDIRLEVYRPAWVEDYLESLQQYHTPEYRRRREETIATREAFGLE